MNVKLRGCWKVAAGFCLGGFGVFSLNPLVVGYFTAVCLGGRWMGGTLLASIAALLLNYPTEEAIKYIVTLCGIFILFKIPAVNMVRHQKNVLSVICGAITTTINIAVAISYPDIFAVPEGAIEGILCVAAAIIFSYAINVIEEDYIKISSENESLIAVLLFSVAVMYGMPAYIGPVVLRETFAMFGVLYTLYKFGIGTGITWTIVAAVMMSYLTGEEGYITVWIVIAVLSHGIMSMFKTGRIPFAITFVGVYYICGIFFYKYFLSVDCQQVLISSVFIFMLLPSRYMLHATQRISSEELQEMSPEWGRLIIDRVNSFANAFKRIDFTFAGEMAAGIGFNDVGEIIENFTNQLEYEAPVKKTIEAAIVEELGKVGVQIKNIAFIKNSQDKYEVYITSKAYRGGIVSAERVRRIVSAEMGIKMKLKEEGRSFISRDYGIVCLIEEPRFVCKAFVKRVSRYDGEVSGDNFYIGELNNGQFMAIISDGMGNGEYASSYSNNLLESLEELLAAGFNKDMAIRIVNLYLAGRDNGEIFATLDMFILDLYTGYGKLYKQGAAATFVKKGEWIEIIKSTSLPVGIVENAVCEKCSKKFYTGDIVVMVSDGVLESVVFDNKENYLRDLIAKSECEDPEELANDIIEEIKSISGNRFADDATVIVLSIMEKNR